MARFALLAFVVGCRVTGEFHCETSDQCRDEGTTGLCLTGSCAFGDTACTSGWRYGDTAAEEIAGECLDGDAPADCAAWKPKHFTPCALPAPLGAMTLAGASYIYDTDRGEFIGGPDVPHTSIVVPQANGTATRIMSVASFTLDPGLRLRVVGSLPLIIAAWGDITVNGLLDVSSASFDVPGAGAGGPGCTATGGGAAVATKGAGGGGGGAFAGAGGDGGDADRDHAPGVVGGVGGTAITTPTANVRGGCSGASGGVVGPGAVAPLSAGSAAAGGEGGGAVQLTARGKLVVGSIHAGGAAGFGGPGQESGGGGGGSGGFIGLEGATITVTGILAANGGGGGAGAAAAAAAANSGTNATVTNNAAGGGSAAQCASAGGRGAASTTLVGESATRGDLTSCGGGGGGGGAGVISIRSTTFTMTGATFSPPVTIDP